jgi:hypothetical protein
VLALLLAGCAAGPAPIPKSLEDELPPISEPPPVEVPAPLIESPPLEPVEPPLPEPAPVIVPAPARPTPGPPSTTPVPSPAPAPATATPPATVIIESPEDAQMVALLGDLSRYTTMSGDEVRREVSTMTQALARTRTDANRVRLAVLYTLSRTSPQDDQRALQLFDNVAKSGGPASPVKNLAVVLQVQLVERQRAVRDEQQKSEQAVRKLDQMLELERALLRDRVRSGGGGGGGGGAGGSGH